MKNLSFQYFSLLLFLSCLTLSSTITTAQEYEPYKLYEGYVIHKDGTREEGYIWYGDPSHNTGIVLFYEDKDNRKTRKKYKPKKIKGYKVGSEEYHTIKWGIIIKQTQFARVVNKGHIMTYEAAEYNEKEKKYDWVKVLKKGDDKPVGVSKFIFGTSKKLSAYLSDYPELAKKIKNKEKGYRLRNLETILEKYNEWYAKKK